MKVLCAVDGSQCSQWGVEALSGLVDQRPSSLVLLHVVNTAVPRSLRAKDLAKAKQALAAADKAGERVLERMSGIATMALSEAVTGPRTRVQSRLVHGDVAKSIIRQADRQKSDMVIVGSRGLTDAPSFLLGSVARKVFSLANRAVLVVKRPLPEIKRVVLALDGSSHAEAAGAFLRKNFLPQSAHVTVLAVAQPIVSDLAASVLPLSQLRRLSKPVKDQARQLAERCRERFLREGFEVETEVVTGHPVLNILQYLERTGADLVALGSRGLTGVERLVLGSVSEGILQHAPCSVLVVRKNPG